MPTQNIDPPERTLTQWVDRTWKPSHMSGFAGYMTGWGGVLLGLYLLVLWLMETFTGHVSKDLFTYIGTLLVGFIFLGCGLIGISMSKNLANRAQVIDFGANNTCRITFWWRGRRKDIEFELNDVERVEPCQKESGIIDLLANLPREPICYQVKVRGQPSFIVTGTDEAIYDVMKRFSGQDSCGQTK